MSLVAYGEILSRTDATIGRPKLRKELWVVEMIRREPVPSRRLTSQSNRPCRLPRAWPGSRATLPCRLGGLVLRSPPARSQPRPPRRYNPVAAAAPELTPPRNPDAALHYRGSTGPEGPPGGNRRGQT